MSGHPDPSRRDEDREGSTLQTGDQQPLYLDNLIDAFVIPFRDGIKVGLHFRIYLRFKLKCRKY